MQKTRHETMKKNGTYTKSWLEDDFYDELLIIYSEQDVERAVRINNRSIDFYIKSIDTYIQFDGIYWHALDKPLEEIKTNEPQRYKWYLKDRAQDEWFAANKLKLVRITDKEFLNESFDINQFISTKLSQ